jgi:hypothetical protein
MEYKGIEVIKNSDYFFTIGLNKYIRKELMIPVLQRSDEEYFKLLTYLIDYVCQPSVVINPNETIAYHSWVLQFVATSERFYEISEVGRSRDGYQVGVDNAIKVFDEQKEVCIKYKIEPISPLFSQYIVISKGVYEGVPTEGVRYPSPSHMSGWWLTTDEYDGNINTLLNVHYYHIAFKRPDILKYLALPFGYRFFKNAYSAEIWYDEKVMNSNGGIADDR